MVSADGTIIHNDVPSPQCYGIPLSEISKGSRQSLTLSPSHTFLTSNLFLPSKPASAPPDLADLTLCLGFDDTEASASGISMSAMLNDFVRHVVRGGQRSILGGNNFKDRILVAW